MKNLQNLTVSLAIMALFSAAAAWAEPPPLDPTMSKPIPPPVPIKPPQLRHSLPQRPVIPSIESGGEPSAAASAGLGVAGVFSAFSTASASPSTALAPPVTITYGGTGTALSVTDTGTGNAVHSSLTKATNKNSALYGTTVGTGAGVTGVNTGTGGPGGAFQLPSASSAESAVFATTAGTGSAVLGTVTNTTSLAPAIYGQSTVSADYGIGVEGDGNYIGVSGYSLESVGVWGQSQDGNGVYAFSSSNAAVYADSYSSSGVLGLSTTSIGVYGVTSGTDGVYGYNESSGHGVTGYSTDGIGVYGTGPFGVFGASTNGYAVIGNDSGSGQGLRGTSSSGIGVYGYSATGLAGYFAGTVEATSYAYTSDKNAKTNIQPIDNKDVLERVSRLPISSWHFKSDLKKRHVGPMAQDFHAQFGLNGDDETHINLSDIAGVSLAAIQELNNEMKQKDVQIAELQEQLAAQAKVMGEMKSMAEVLAARMTAFERQREGVARTAANMARSDALPGSTE